MKFKAYLKWAAAGALAVYLGSCSTIDSDRASVKPESQRQMAPDFSLKDSTGATVKLSDFRGKVVVLDFWETWCEPCQPEVPWFKSFEQKYKDQGFAVLGVSLDEDGWKAVRPYLQEKKLNYRVMVGTDELGQLYAVDATPSTFMIDRQGRIARRHVGLQAKSTFEGEIAQLLESPQHEPNRTSMLRSPGGLFAFLRARP